MCDVNTIPPKRDVAFVCGEKEFIAIINPLEQATENDFPKILKMEIIANRKFIEAKQTC
jgi:hypothetical protein